MAYSDSAIDELTAAIRSHDVNALLRAAQQGIDTNAYDSEGETPLIHAAACGNAVAVDFLLRHGADPLRVNLPRTESPFLIAILNRDAVVTRLLLNAGRLTAQSRRREFWYDADILFLDRDTTRLVTLVREGLDPNTSLSGNRQITLLALFLNRLDILAVSTLVQHGCNLFEVIDAGGGGLWLPLHWAVDKGLAEIVWLLLLDGADPNCSGEGWSPLFLAARYPSSEIAELLLDAGAAVDVGLAKETPLMRASTDGYLDTVQLLVAHGACVNSADSLGRTPLHYAASGGHHAVVRFLLEAGADPSRRDESGYTAADDGILRKLSRFRIPSRRWLPQFQMAVL